MLAKFIGDAVMAVFGLTELHEDDALRAVRAAVEMRETLARLNEDFERRYGVVLATRTGINTGTVAGKGHRPRSQLRRRRHGEQRRASPAGRRAGRDPPRRVDVQARPRVGRGRARCRRSSSRASRRRSLRTGCSPSRERAEPAPRLDAPLVGRQDTLAQLEWALERAVAERSCRLVTVVGAPGIGKSRLAHEFVAALGEQRDRAPRTLPSVRRGDHVLAARRRWSSRQRASTRATAADDAVAKLEALLRARRRRSDASPRRSPSSPGSGRRRASSRRASGPCGGSSRASRPSARSSSCSTTRTGPRRRSSRWSRTSRVTRSPFRSSCSASAGRTCSSDARTGARAPAREHAW